MRPFRVLLVIVAGVLAAFVARSLQRTDLVDDIWPETPSVPDDTPTPLPIAQYDELRAVDIAATIRTFDDPEAVLRVLQYEEAHNQRVTVFRAAKARLRALETARERVGA